MSREVSASADDAGRRSDDGVRRLREESARRVEQRGCVKAFSSWCALATLAGGISLAALGASDARQARSAAVAQAEAGAVDAAAAHAAAVAEAAARDHREQCLRLAAASRELGALLGGGLARAHGKKQRDRIWAEMQERHAPIAQAQAERGCPVLRLEPEAPRRREFTPSGCGCAPCGRGF